MGPHLRGIGNQPPVQTSTATARPPPQPHQQNSQCSSCHSDVVAPDGTIVSLEKHINGVVDAPTMSCNSCHGNTINNAPPTDTQGRSDTTLPSVGAHQTHLLAPGNVSAPVPCGECHTVPATFDEPGHIENAPARVVLGQLSQRENVQAAYDRDSAICITYCHGTTLPNNLGGNARPPNWTRVDGTQNQCSSCHGHPPAPDPFNNGDDESKCESCHSGYTVNTVNRILHLDGNISKNSCVDCHADFTTSHLKGVETVFPC